MTRQTADADRGQSAPACSVCGTPPSPGQSFCESCGAVLSWTPSPVRRPEPASVGSDDTPWQGIPGAGAGAASGPGPGLDSGPAYGIPDDAETARSDRTAGGHGGNGGNGGGGGAGWQQGASPAPQPAHPGVPSPYPSHTGSGSGQGNVNQQGNQQGNEHEHGHGSGHGHWAAAPAAPDYTYPETADTAATARSRAAAPGTPAPEAAPASAHAPAPAPVPAPAPANDPLATERARALLIPVADPGRSAPPPSVAPVQPGRPVTARPQVQAPQGQGDDGAALCPWCGTGNRPDRHFCRRCALSMTGRPDDPGRRLPWWRRLPGLGERRVPWAGERPRLRRGLGRIWTWVVGAVVLALLVTAALNVGTAVQAVRDHFTKRAPIAANSYKASHSWSGHGPALAFDKINNTWWGPGRNQSGAGEWIEADFDQPTHLLDIVFTSGESAQPMDLSKSALPQRIEAVVTTADGKTQSRFVTLDGASGGQARAFRVKDVTSVRFIVRAAFGASADKQVAIAEIEFFGPSSSGSS